MGISLFPTRGTVSNPTTLFIYNISRCVSRSTLHTYALPESSSLNPREQASAGPGLPQRGKYLLATHVSAPTTPYITYSTASDPLQPDNYHWWETGAALQYHHNIAMVWITQCISLNKNKLKNC